MKIKTNLFAFNMLMNVYCRLFAIVTNWLVFTIWTLISFWFSGVSNTSDQEIDTPIVNNRPDDNSLVPFKGANMTPLIPAETLTPDDTGAFLVGFYPRNAPSECDLGRGVYVGGFEYKYWFREGGFPFDFLTNRALFGQQRHLMWFHFTR